MPSAREHRCPACRSTLVARASAKSLVELLMLLLRLRRYTCRDCGNEFWDRRL